MNSPVVFNSEQLTILNVVNEYVLNETSITSRTASGVSEVTLNETSGIVTFSEPVGNNPTAYIINSDKISAEDNVLVEILSTDAEDSYAIKCNQIVDNGIIELRLYDGGTGNGSISTTIMFKKL